MRFENIAVVCLVAASSVCGAAPVVKVEKAGAEKITVAVNVQGSAWYQKCLKKNLELSGIFKVAPSGTITVTGLAGGSVTAAGRGKTVRSNEAVSGDPSARMAARRFSGGSAIIFLPSKEMVPLSAVTSPARIRSKVDLPHPEGPSKKTSSP